MKRRIWAWGSILLAGITLCLLLRSLRQPSYQITNLGTLGGNNNYPYALNDKGQVVGCAQSADGSTHAFLWEQGHMTELAVPSGQSACAWAINNRCQVVGTRWMATHQEHACLWQAGKLQDLSTLGGRRS